jgi:tetratricopeptide (TPR) repeat protein
MKNFSKNKTNSFFQSVIPVTTLAFSLFLSSFACAGSNHIKPAGDVHIAESDSKPSFETQIIQSEPEVFDLKFAPTTSGAPDEKQQSYINYMLSAINVWNGNFIKAIENLEKVMAYDPDSAYLKKRMALVLSEIKKYDLSLKYAEESLLINPDDIGTKILLADLYSMKGDNSSAVNQYKEILSLEPDNQRVRMMFSTALARSGMLDEALEQLNILTDNTPDFFFAHYYKGKIYQAMRKFEQAEKEYLTVLSINDVMEPALFDLAGLYFMQGQLEQAAESYPKIFQI